MKLNIFTVGLLTVLAGLQPGSAAAADVALNPGATQGSVPQNVALAPATHPSSPAPADLLKQTLDDYKIGPSDLIEISVFQVPELSKTVRVGARGVLTLPLIGQVEAAGLSGEELEQLIAKKLSQSYLQDPQVSVFIKEYISQRVTVEGSVNKPGVFPISGKTTLLQAIAMAGGLDKLADQNDIKLFRDRKDGTRETIPFDLEPIRKGEAPDPVLSTSDVIVVGKSGARSAIREFGETMRDFSIFGLFF
jgi:polysaccharide export outer membrane protein